MRILGDNTRLDLNFITNLKHTTKKRTTRDTTLRRPPTRHTTYLKILNGLARLVNIEGTNNNQVRRRSVVTNRNGNDIADVLADDVDVVLELSTDRDDRSLISHCTSNELTDTIILLHGLLGLHKIYFIRLWNAAYPSCSGE